MASEIFFGRRPPDPEGAHHPPDMSKEATVAARPSCPDFGASQADVDLVRAASAGEREAQARLVKRLMGRANRLAQALLRNRQDASDASQAALIAILRSSSNFRGESSLESWADRIVVRTALRLSRRNRRDQGRQLDEGPHPCVMQAGEARLSAAHYLRCLSEPQRTALLLCSGFGYSVAEIAELTQAPENTVKDRLKRARSALRQQLQRERHLSVSAAEPRFSSG